MWMYIGDGHEHVLRVLSAIYCPCMFAPYMAFICFDPRENENCCGIPMKHSTGDLRKAFTAARFTCRRSTWLFNVHPKCALRGDRAEALSLLKVRIWDGQEHMRHAIATILFPLCYCMIVDVHICPPQDNMVLTVDPSWTTTRETAVRLSVPRGANGDLLNDCPMYIQTSRCAVTVAKNIRDGHEQVRHGLAVFVERG